MRDVLLTTFIFAMLPFALRRPWIGVLMWVWVGVMSPHRLTWGFAYDLPFAMLIAVVTLVGMVFSKDPKHMPITPVTVVLFLLFIWMHVSLVFSFNMDGSLVMWDKVVKIFFMLFVTMYLLHSQQHVKLLTLVITASVAFYGIKGGLFTLRIGGDEKVYGPAGSFIQENNALAVAVIMAVPLLRYYHQQAKQGWLKWGLVAAMLLCGISALGSQSRGALLAISAMGVFLWIKSRNKLMTLVIVAVAAPLALGFMPESWHDRMDTIATYETDGSAMGRIDAWLGAVSLANDRPLVGGGFAIYSDSILGRYTPSGKARSTHSIWFQFLGEHGYPGLILFVLLWIFAWKDASRIIRECRDREGWSWASDLARMIQVSLIGYLVGGSLLQLAYFDVPYYLVIALVLVRVLVEKEKQMQTADGAQLLKIGGKRNVLGPVGPSVIRPSRSR